MVSNGSVSVACDATRLGRPGEDTMAYAMWDCKTHASGWLICQVVSGVDVGLQDSHFWLAHLSGC